MQIDILNDSKEIALTIYFTSAILVVVVIVSVVWEENLTIYSATYAYGIAISTTATLITVFFTKVCSTIEPEIFTLRNFLSICQLLSLVKVFEYFSFLEPFFLHW